MKALRYTLTVVTSALAFATVATACDKRDISCQVCAAWNKVRIPLLDPKCTELKCLPDWPSSSGNYDGPKSYSGPIITRRHAKDVSAHSESDGLPTNNTTTPVSSLPQAIHALMTEINPGFNNTEQRDADPQPPTTQDGVQKRDDSETECCTFTWECWKFMDSRSVSEVLYNYENMQIFGCCLVDFARKRPGCQNPVNPWGVGGAEPPQCITESSEDW